MKPCYLLALFVFASSASFADVPAEVLNPDVHQDTINETICQKGYTKSVRPSTIYTNGVKQKLMRKQGIDWNRASELELDHIVPLVLGGHPRNIHNLTLQPWDGALGAKVKDKLEVRLAREVCTGKISLAAAQECIWSDWKACATTHPGRRW
ncbi:MAG TPA: hypothetical protein VJ577_08570 [Burkholderiaceae bacterium]|nr:hypothetical protein [Burkholderiaceae bacterium]